MMVIAKTENNSPNGSTDTVFFILAKQCKIMVGPSISYKF